MSEPACLEQQQRSRILRADASCHVCLQSHSICVDDLLSRSATHGTAYNNVGLSTKTSTGSHLILCQQVGSFLSTGISATSSASCLLDTSTPLTSLNVGGIANTSAAFKDKHVHLMPQALKTSVRLSRTPRNIGIQALRVQSQSLVYHTAFKKHRQPFTYKWPRQRAATCVSSSHATVSMFSLFSKRRRAPRDEGKPGLGGLNAGAALSAARSIRTETIFTVVFVFKM